MSQARLFWQPPEIAEKNSKLIVLRRPSANTQQLGLQNLLFQNNDQYADPNLARTIIRRIR